MIAPRVGLAAALLCGAAALTACASTVSGSASGSGSTTERTTTERTTTSTAPAGDVDVPASIPTELAPMPKRTTALPAKVDCEYRTEQGAAPAKDVDAPPATGVSAQGTAAATIALGGGDVAVTLDRALAPCAVNNFVSLAKQGYYDDTTCHRLTTAESLQVLQCGDPTGTGSGGPGYTFDDEVFPELEYGRGMLAMANAGTGSDGNGTNGSQFFIVYGACEIPPNYTVFGSIDAASMAVVDEIAKAGTVSEGMPGDGKPSAEVVISGVEVA
ncbi:peptidylprolyl isomerase [Actinokineospora sp. UTMC 2448]|uniref:peptidylprolyl isomerase n=1 Tax=Actinokineospora sp. UTMC 2448 TaxID=2268449 RepID=UPI00216497B3|nr:peptidylprolyl isomerase [Actinokineospora sp. UTMC 2448]UVS78255.1 Peptidyl-prolyl cis-trans isomerase B [Actinokineospora sp. UTMC 2448]